MYDDVYDNITYLFNKVNKQAKIDKDYLIGFAWVNLFLNEEGRAKAISDAKQYCEDIFKEKKNAAYFDTNKAVI